MNNSLPAGTVTINGFASQGQCLQASHNLVDADGLSNVTYQWFANGASIATGYRNEYYVLQQSDVGKQITVKASYVDGAGNLEVISSQSTEPVLNVNDSPDFLNLISPGAVRTDLGGFEDVDIAFIQEDGKILVGGSSAYNWALVRYNADGSLDNSFDNDGKLLFGSNYLGKIQSIAQLPNGQLLVGGTLSVSSGSGATTSLEFTRLNLDGSIDKSYGINGKCNLSGYQYLFNAALQSDGSLFVSANKNLSTNTLIKLTASGVLDENFINKGIFEPGGRTGFVVRPDNSILVARWTDVDTSQGRHFSVSKYDTIGQINRSLSASDITKSDLIDFLCSMGNQNIKSIGANLGLTSRLGVYADDVNFVVQRWLWPSIDVFQLALQTNNEVTGFLPPTIGASAAAYLDKSFGFDGFAVSDLSRFDVPSALMVQKDGKILVAGKVLSPATSSFRLNYYSDNGSWSISSSGGGNDFGVIRLNPDGSIDNTFGVESTDLRAANYTEGDPPVILSTSVSVSDIDAQAKGTYSNCTLTMQRWGGASKKDVFSISTDGVILALLPNNDLTYRGQTIGLVVNEVGQMKINFTGVSVSQSVVNDVLQHIQYQNISGTPPPALKIEWSFSDGVQTTKGLSSVVLNDLVNDSASLDRLVIRKWNDQVSLDSFYLREGAPVKLAPTDRAHSGVSLTDVLSTLKIYLGKSTSNSPPYQFIAADFDADGVVSLSDVLLLLKYYLGKNTGGTQPEWVFVNASAVVEQGNDQIVLGLNGQALSKANTLAPAPDVDASTGEKLEVIGVLRGDVDGSWVGS